MKANENKELLIKVTPPQITETYTPMLYQQIIDIVYDSFKRLNIVVSNEHYVYDRNGQRALGLYSIKYPSYLNLNLLFKYS